jgi:hypothetical protein
MTLDFTPTREALHRVAEHVVAAAQARAGAGIRLRCVAGGGFETLVGLPDGRRIGVIGRRIVVDGPHGRRDAELTTVAAAARFVGTEPGLPSGIYDAATPFEPSRLLDIDDRAAAVLFDWFALADDALRRFGEDVGGGPQQPVLWPEHFDVGITIDAVNYGASPGDQHVVDPYLYVGPHAGPPTRDEYWNTAFGAARTITDVRSVDDAVRFFAAGRNRLDHVRTRG